MHGFSLCLKNGISNDCSVCIVDLQPFTFLSLKRKMDFTQAIGRKEIVYEALGYALIPGHCLKYGISIKANGAFFNFYIQLIWNILPECIYHENQMRIRNVHV